MHFIELKRPTFVRVLADVRKRRTPRASPSTAWTVSESTRPRAGLHDSTEAPSSASSVTVARILRRTSDPSRTARERKRDDRRDADGDADATPAPGTRVRTRRAHDGASQCALDARGRGTRRYFTQRYVTNICHLQARTRDMSATPRGNITCAASSECAALETSTTGPLYCASVARGDDGGVNGVDAGVVSLVEELGGACWGCEACTKFGDEISWSCPSGATRARRRKTSRRRRFSRISTIESSVGARGVALAS